MRVGFLINPIAGMGGAVGLKGTDTPEILGEAIKRGAVPQAADKAVEALEAIGALQGYDFVTAGGSMGESVLRDLQAAYKIVYIPRESTGPEDTKAACLAFLEKGIEVLLFAGGDGTARDIMDVVDEKIPLIGIPSGVKMHSGVFATTPHNAGILLKRFRVDGLSTQRAEVMDINEEDFRQGRLSASLYGYVLTPHEPSLVQSMKLTFGGGSEEADKDAIGLFVAERMEPDVLYILGPGSTVEAVARALEVPKSLLGVDVVLNGKVLMTDASELDLLGLLQTHSQARIVVSPIGAQGFIFGRGNQQISAKIIRAVGAKNIIIVATPGKLRETKVLRVDTGDPSLDDELKGYGKVVISYGMERIVPVE